MTISINFDYKSQMKLNNKAKHMKVNVTSQQNIYYQLLLPFGFITMQAYHI